MRYSDYEQGEMDAESGLHLDRQARKLHPTFRSILEAHGAPKALDRTCNMCGALPGHLCSVTCPENDPIKTPIPERNMPKIHSPSVNELLALSDQEKVKRFDAMARSTFSHVDGRDLLDELHPRRMLDIKRRVDGVETWFEGDWLSKLREERNGGHGWWLTDEDRERIAKAALDDPNAGKGDERRHNSKPQ
jgi:hypothetical protein